MDAGDWDFSKAAVPAALLAVFFVAGFLAGGGSTGQAQATSVQQDTVDVTRAEAVDKAVKKLEAGPLSYPFTYNVSVASVTNDTRIPGTTFYNVTLSFVVEPNPFQSPLYTVPGNQSTATKSLTVYVSEDGKLMFQSPPITTEVSRRGPVVGP